MNCRRCDRETVPQRTWDKASPAKRSVWLAEGLRMLQGRGLCRGCYLRAYKAGEIAPRASRGVSEQPRPCGRCGINTTAELCQDCVDVEVCA